MSLGDAESDNSDSNQNYLPPFSRTNILGAGNRVENGHLKAVKSIEHIKQAMMSPVNGPPKKRNKPQLAQIQQAKSRTRGRFEDFVAQPEQFMLVQDKKM